LKILLKKYMEKKGVFYLSLSKKQSLKEGPYSIIKQEEYKLYICNILTVCKSKFLLHKGAR